MITNLSLTKSSKKNILNFTTQFYISIFEYIQLILYSIKKAFTNYTRC